jgi:hypothetical protein
MVIGAFTLTAVLTVFVMIGKIQTNALNYAEMERDAQRSLERFGQDTRMASKVTTSPTSYTSTTTFTNITLTIPHPYDAGTDSVQYQYDSTNKQLKRIGPDPVTGAANTTVILARNVQDCKFKTWKLASLGGAISNFETDLLQVQVTMTKSRNTTVTTSDLVVSASYLLRNHKYGT